MRLVFKQKEPNMFSLESLSKFHRLANQLCEEAFVVIAPEDLTEIRMRESPMIKNTKEILYVVKLIAAAQVVEENDLLSKAKEEWKSIGEIYNWCLKGVLKDTVDLPPAIDAEINNDDWHESDYDA